MTETIWNQSMSVGIESWDQDHRELLRLIDELKDLEQNESHQVIISCLEYLMEYAEAHLASEERVMKDEMYPDIKSHKAKHDFYRRRITELQKKFEDGDKDWNLSKLIAFLMSWWIEHINKEDHKYKTFFQNKQKEIEGKLLSERWRKQL